MPKTETRFAELRADDDGTVSGVAMAYGTVAVIGGQPERFEPNSLEFPATGVFLNVQHQRNQPVAKYPDGGLELRDNAESLSLRARLADTTVGRDAWVNIKSKILSGLSIEFQVLEERFEGATRVISKAMLRAVSIVDVPAYSQSTVQARQLEWRQDTRTITGEFPYNEPITISDTSKIRKAMYIPGVFEKTLELNREIMLYLQSGGQNVPVAARSTGALKFSDNRHRLRFEAAVQDTSYLEDFIANVESKTLNYQIRPNIALPPPERVPPSRVYRDVLENDDVPDVYIRQYTDVILNSLLLQPRGGAGKIAIRWKPWL